MCVNGFWLYWMEIDGTHLNAKSVSYYRVDKPYTVSSQQENISDEMTNFIEIPLLFCSLDVHTKYNVAATERHGYVCHTSQAPWKAATLIRASVISILELRTLFLLWIINFPLTIIAFTIDIITNAYSIRTTKRQNNCSLLLESLRWIQYIYAIQSKAS